MGLLELLSLAMFCWTASLNKVWRQDGENTKCSILKLQLECPERRGLFGVKKHLCATHVLSDYILLGLADMQKRQCCHHLVKGV